MLAIVGQFLDDRQTLEWPSASSCLRGSLIASGLHNSSRSLQKCLAIVGRQALEKSHDERTEKDCESELKILSKK